MWNVIDSIDVLIFIDLIESMLLISKTKFADSAVDWFSWIVSSIFCRTFSCPMSSVDRVAAFESINRSLNFVSSYLNNVEEMYAYEMLEFSVFEFSMLKFFDSLISVIWYFATLLIRRLVIKMQSEFFNVFKKVQNTSFFSWTLNVAEISEANSGSICNFSKYWVILSSSSLSSKSVMYWISFRV